MSGSHPLREVLADLSAAFRTLGSRWYVFGAQAVVLWGRPRLTKILAGRSKDLEDVRGILAERHGRLDRETIRSTLRLLEDALGQSDLLPVFEAEWIRSASSEHR